MDSIWRFFEGIANFTVPYWFLHWIDNLLNGFRESKIHRLKHKDKENWALVTGASDGIGEGFAHDLAERGFNVILHGRNSEKLKKKEDLLKASYPQAKTRIWIADATKDFPLNALKEITKDIHLTLLINNVGGLPPGHPEYSALELQPFEHIDRTIHMNIGFTTKLEAALLPMLIKNQPSCILNISSLGSLGSPFVSVYAGSKAYLNTHSMSLQSELEGQGKDVIVHSVMVGKVISGSIHGDVGLATPSSRTMAKATLDNIGLRSCVMTPYLPHLFQVCLFGLLPESMARKMMWSAMAASMDAAEKWKTA